MVIIIIIIIIIKKIIIIIIIIIDHVLVKLDFTNAFSSIRRDVILEAVAAKRLKFTV